MSSRYESAKKVLEQLVRNNPYIELAEVVSADGLPIAGSIDAPEEEARIAAMAAAMSGVAARCVSEIKKGKVDWIGIFSEGGGGTIIIDINPETYLIAVFSGEKFGLVLYDIKKARDELAKVFA